MDLQPEICWFLQHTDALAANRSRVECCNNAAIECQRSLAGIYRRTIKMLKQGGLWEKNNVLVINSVVDDPPYKHRCTNVLLSLGPEHNVPLSESTDFLLCVSCLVVSFKRARRRISQKRADLNAVAKLLRTYCHSVKFILTRQASLFKNDSSVIGILC